jgi:hypothetical protein
LRRREVNWGRGSWKRPRLKRDPNRLSKDVRTRRLALLIAALAALLLALVSMQEKILLKTRSEAIPEVSDLWSFFQAKTARQFTLERDSEMSSAKAPHPRSRPLSTLCSRIGQTRSPNMVASPGRKELMARAKAAADGRDKALAANNDFG